MGMRGLIGTGRRRVLVLGGVGLLIAGTANAAAGRATGDQPPVLDTVVTVTTTAPPATMPATTEPATTASEQTTVASSRATTATTEPTTVAATEPPTVATTEATEPPTVAATQATEPPSIATTKATRAAPPAGECDPNYAGACVPIDSDVDCSSGKGNGPSYVRGPVQVVGVDIYRLDSDGDGIGCEKG